MRKGSKGRAVRQLQKLLRITVDGDFGNQTRNAVIAYERKYGRTITGEDSPWLWASLSASRAKTAVRDTYVPSKKFDAEDIPALVEGLFPLFRKTKRNRELLIAGLTTLYTCKDKLGLSSREDILKYIANVREEVGANITLTESLNYSSTALPKLFSFYRRNRLQATIDGRTSQHKANQRSIANRAYANRVGNGDASSQDGWNFRGQGDLMLTGRDNYTKVAKDVKAIFAVNILKTPGSLHHQKLWMIAGAVFWMQHNLGGDRSVSRAALDRTIDKINRHTHSRNSRWKHLSYLSRRFPKTDQSA